MSSAVRIAPSEGYATDEKAKYRRDVWSAIRRNARTNLKFCRVMLMPSIEGLEIAVAEEFGCVREKIVAVDYSPAIAATVSRKYPGITAWGCDAFAAAERAANSGFRFDVLHLDMTCNLSPAALDGLKGTAAHVRSGAIVVTNFMKGRESPVWLNQWLAESTDAIVETWARRIDRSNWRGPQMKGGKRIVLNKPKTKEEREEFVSRIASAHWCRRSFAIEIATGWRQIGSVQTYTSGRVPMQWSVWRT